MADSVERKRKRISRNKKKYWRTADVNDVEQYLEDKRLQERTGGLVSEKKDDDLFFVDSAAPASEPDIPHKKRRKGAKPLKCHSALLPDPRIKPIRVKHNIKKERQKKVFVSKKKVQQPEVHPKRRSQLTRKGATFDIWEQEEDNTAADEHYLRVTKKKLVKPSPKFHGKPSSLPAVEVAHPGGSYNPAYDDHQQLLEKAHVVEVKKMKDEAKITRALDSMFPDEANAPTEESKTQELAEGLFNESDSDSDEELEDDRLSCNPPVRRENKKTEKQRKKEKMLQQEKEKALNLKNERIKKNEIFRLKTIKKDVREMLSERVERQKKRKEKAELEKTRTKRLGKHKFEEPDLDIKLSDEICGSLRLLKPEGHLLEDRMKSLQKRNIIEPRQRVKRTRKYKRKVFTKTTHRNLEDPKLD